tara:strand:+ start:5077 stop:5814 length:738 start_codon:yes stop_codon:yes gene_type:complete
MIKSNRNILVLGGTSGIGNQVGKDLCHKGFKVYSSGRSKTKIDQLQKTNPNITYLKADLTNTEDIDLLINNIENPLEGLVYSAGSIYLKPLKYLTDEDFSNTIAINLTAPFMLIRRLLVAKKLAKGASIVLMSSITGIHKGLAGGVAYGASKAGLIGMMKSMAIELAKRKIRINAISPGMIATEGTSKYLTSLGAETVQADLQNYPLGIYGSTTDISAMVIYLMNDGSAWITGQDFVIDGGRTLK